MLYLKYFESKENITICACEKSEKTYNFVSDYLSLMPYEDYINNDNLYQVCCYKNDLLIGVRIFRMKEGKIHLNYSAVKKEFRNRGVNKMMFDKIKEIAIENNVSLITSNVRESNISSIKSLLSCGFKINDRVNLYYPDGERKIPFFIKL